MAASIRATVDGGTNIWYKFSLTLENELNNPIPDLVTGDFDSAEPRCITYYQSHGAKIVHTPDQDETDFNKCVRLVFKELVARKRKVASIILIDTHVNLYDPINL